MARLKFQRKLGTAWVFELTWKDRTGARQSIASSSSRKAFWRASGTDDTVLITDTGGITIDETADPDTYGDFTYTRTDLTAFAVGTYRLDFEVTLNALVVPAPEDGYVIVEVLA